MSKKVPEYNHTKIEKKWQKQWQKKEIYKTKDTSRKPKCYVLDMFPYPSGVGIHVGHPKGFIATDIYSRFKRMNGYNVLHPMGWDAFGLPAENYAIKNKVHPAQVVAKNIKRYKKQLEIIGFDYDWSREISTTDPDYYKWTQWIFLQMYKKGLAYESYEPINWCPSCQTGLANEDLEDGLCERCGSEIEKKPMRQWVLKITKYADRLLKDLDDLNWPESIKEAQRNWIGRSEGVKIKFPVPVIDKDLEIFTTRPDTIFGVTFMALSPEVAEAWVESGHLTDKAVRAYVQKTLKERAKKNYVTDQQKSGIFSGLYAVNPANNKKVPIWIVNYVMGDVGTGAIMAVPAHDERDNEFAIKYDLPIKEVIKPNEKTTGVFTGVGHLKNSGQFNGLDSQVAKTAIAKYVRGKKTVSYKIKDWVFSRQRYWGEPIPLIHCDNCGVVPVPESDLPVKLPQVKNYQPTGTGESPLVGIESWVRVKCPQCNSPAKRETNTMPQWAGSSWYYLRYIDPTNKKVLVDPRKEKKWQPVDLYVGGTEHATRHLIYARFWHKFLYDQKVVSTKEPVKRLGRNLGLVLGTDGRKMSKRWGNVVNPDDVVKTYGADTLRLYEMFMGPFEAEIAWSTDSLIGSRRFVERVWLAILNRQNKPVKQTDKNIKRLLEQTIKKVSADIETMDYNTMVSALMTFIKELGTGADDSAINLKDQKRFIQILAPVAPHLAEELWQALNGTGSVHLSAWPQVETKYLETADVKIAVQINGKVRGVLELTIDTPEEEATALALAQEGVARHIQASKIKKVIYIPGKILNLIG
ncbi:MAG: leucine--tRNA ligase [Patescibacteria group bacterium]